jgi:hypothetical protein
LTEKDDKIGVMGLEVVGEDAYHLVTNTDTDVSRIDVYDSKGFKLKLDLESIGKATCLNKSPTSDLLIVSGKDGIAIIEDKEIIYEINTDFEVRLVGFSHDEKTILLVDGEGYFRSFPWK